MGRKWIILTLLGEKYIIFEKGGEGQKYQIF